MVCKVQCSRVLLSNSSLQAEAEALDMAEDTKMVEALAQAQDMAEALDMDTNMVEALALDNMAEALDMDTNMVEALAENICHLSHFFHQRC